MKKTITSLYSFFHQNPLVVLLIIFLLAFVVRSVSFGFDGLFDPDAHFHVRLSEQIVETHQLLEWDALSLQGRVYSYPPLLHVMLALLTILTGLETLLVIKLFGTFVGALFVVSVYLLAKKMTESNGIALWAAIFSAISAIAAWRTSGFVRPDGVALTLIPFLLYLWFTRREKMAFVLSLAMVLLHPLSTVFYAIILGSWFVVHFFQKKSYPVLIPFALVGMFIVFWLWVFSIGLPIQNYASSVSLEAGELSQFPLLGFILFSPLAWFFVAIGLWKGRMPLLLMVWFFVSILIGAIGVRLSLYWIPFFSIIAGYGLREVIRFIRPAQYGLAILGVFIVIVGAVSVYAIMNDVHPYFSESGESGARFLQSYASPTDSVLTTWDYGHVLAYYSGLPQVIDGYFEFAHELDARNAAMKKAMATSRCSMYVNALDQFKARFHFIPRDELYSLNAEYGALTLERCPSVRTIYSTNDARIHERVPVGSVN